MTEHTATKPMAMLLQDPSIRDANGDYLHEDWLFSLDADYLLGTGSSKFVVRDTDESDSPVFESGDWSDPGLTLTYDNFNSARAERPILENAQFHQVNAFAVAGHTLRLFEEALGRQIRWRHGGPLVIRPHAFEGANAYYDGMSPSLNFGYFRSPIRSATVWTCLSHDIVAHELGHAVFDSFRPLFLYSSELDAAALHESLGDLLALFSALEHAPVVERIFAESGGDMRRPTLVSGLAEEFGIGLRGSGTAYLRSALDGPPYDQADKEPHARSTVWTAAIYDILVELVDAVMEADCPDPEQRRDFECFKQAVVTATRRLRRMTLRALSYAPPTGVTMPVLARMMYEADQRLFPNDPMSRDIAQRVFEGRALWDPALDFAPPGIGTDFRDWDALSVSARAALVARHAEALRIPAGPGIRILAPELITAVRQADAAKDGVETGAVTERYLHYAYEFVFETGIFGENGFEPVTVSVFNGGTLVLDDGWTDVLLATDPPASSDDLAAEDPGRSAFQRAVTRFHETHHSAVQSLRASTWDSTGPVEDRVLYDKPGCAFALKAVGGGALRFVRRRCNVAEHLRAVGKPSVAPASLGRPSTAAPAPAIPRLPTPRGQAGDRLEASSRTASHP
jgi:Thermolysin metallopeptidase, catalytic domain